MGTNSQTGSERFILADTALVEAGVLLDMFSPVRASFPKLEETA
ncbi:MAG: hypothetical protein WBA68_10585 [Alteraurantiacibacter sp.]